MGKDWKWLVEIQNRAYDPKRIRPVGLEKARAQIEAVGCEDQRHRQAYSTKHEEGFDRLDINIGSRCA